MFSFFNTSNANYEKKFFDFNINDINDEKLILSKYKNKTILLVNVDKSLVIMMKLKIFVSQTLI